MKTRRRVLHVVVLLLGTITAGILLSKGQSNVNMLQPIHWDILPEIQIDKHFGSIELNNKLATARFTTKGWNMKGVTHEINTLTETQIDQGDKDLENEDFANKDAVTSKGLGKARLINTLLRRIQIKMTICRILRYQIHHKIIERAVQTHLDM